MLTGNPSLLTLVWDKRCGLLCSQSWSKRWLRRPQREPVRGPAQTDYPALRSCYSGDPGEDIEGRNLGKNVGGAEMGRTYEGFCGEKMIPGLNGPQINEKWRYHSHVMVKFKSKRLFLHWLWVLCPSGCNSIAIQNTLWHLILQFGCKF